MALIEQQMSIEREKNQNEIRKMMQDFIANQAEIQHDYFSDVLKSETEIAKAYGIEQSDVEREQDAGSAAAGS